MIGEFMLSIVFSSVQSTLLQCLHMRFPLSRGADRLFWAFGNFVMGILLAHLRLPHCDTVVRGKKDGVALALIFKGYSSDEYGFESDIFRTFRSNI